MTTPAPRPCTICRCPNYKHGFHPDLPCQVSYCKHPNDAHSSAGHKFSIPHASVLTPVSVQNTGKIPLLFVAEDKEIKLAPGDKAPLAPGNYRVQVDKPDGVVVAKIVYDRELKKFDIQAEGGLVDASFVTLVDLEAVVHPGPAGTSAEAGVEA